MAVVSDLVTSEVIEVQEFPDLGTSYNVRGVPLTVINEKVSFTGAANETMLLEYMKSAVSEDTDV
jgi:predicted DsbA family dithiol-disulfide isomerase|tara:strand:- start:2188 stop:2382 length:195 start_codon:yes stop_codon:yes gene_type:complete